ncbi:MAG: hypothetical protein ABH890_06370 [Bacillota bacterium]
MRVELTSNNYIEINLIDDLKRDIVFVLSGWGYAFSFSREAEPVVAVFNQH